MKSKVLACFMAVATGTSAQWSSTNPEWTNSRVGIFNSSPSHPLHVNENTISSHIAGMFDLIGAGTYTANPLSEASALFGNASSYNNSVSNLIGVQGVATGTGSGGNFGGSYSAGDAANVNIGLYTRLRNATGNNVNAALYADAFGYPGYAGMFVGNVSIGGTIFGSQYGWSSDRRFKKNIQELGDISDRLLKVKTYTYEYRTSEFEKKNFAEGRQAGFIAQELKELFPELVMEDRDGYYYVNYIGMIPMLLEAIKKQQLEINELRSTAMNTGLNTTSGNQQEILSQNEPNPFTKETVLKFTVSPSTTSAYIAVYDLSGKQIKRIEIDERGDANLTLTSDNLQPGIYLYSLIVDGSIRETKRMVVADAK